MQQQKSTKTRNNLESKLNARNDRQLPTYHIDEHCDQFKLQEQDKVLSNEQHALAAQSSCPEELLAKLTTVVVEINNKASET